MEPKAYSHCVLLIHSTGDSVYSWRRKLHRIPELDGLQQGGYSIVKNLQFSWIWDVASQSQGILFLIAFKRSDRSSLQITLFTFQRHAGAKKLLYGASEVMNAAQFLKQVGS